MSKYGDYSTTMNDQECVVDGLVDAGYSRDHIEVHQDAQHLYGYQGDLRKEKAHIIVRRKHVGGAANDLGFRQEADGTYTAVVSAFDRGKHNDRWMSDFRKGYLAAKQTKEWKAKGFTDVVKEKVQTDKGWKYRLTATPPGAMTKPAAQTLGLKRS